MRYLFVYSKKFVSEEISRHANELASMIAVNVTKGHLKPIGKEHENRSGVPCLVMKVAGRGEANKRLMAASLEYADFGAVTDHFVDVHFRNPRFGTFRFSRTSPTVFEVPETALHAFQKIATALDIIVQEGIKE